MDNTQLINQKFKNLTFIAIALGVLITFSLSKEWTQLCAGLALFLFGMQCMEEALHTLAEGKLKTILAKSTETPAKGMLFGIGATTLMQSTTLVSLLTIAFINSGMIRLAGGISIILGANLGATSGIWLLAMAGQNISLSPLALPMIAMSMLISFRGEKNKALGRIILGIAFIFLGIDWIKSGFAGFTENLDFSAYQTSGLTGILIFAVIGLTITVVLQSSHATLMLTLAALASGQINLGQSLAIAIGSNVGSSISTVFVGILGSNRSGQRLALAHLIFNVTSAILAFVLINPLTWIVQSIFNNILLQLAFFHTLFNSIGIAIFWPIQNKLASILERLWPDTKEPAVIDTSAPENNKHLPDDKLHARYLSESVLATSDTAINALIQETQFLGRLSLEVICEIIYFSIKELTTDKSEKKAWNLSEEDIAPNADRLYQKYIKGVYSDLLVFSGKIDTVDDTQQQIVMGCQIAALQLVETVKNAKHFQKNLQHFLTSSPVSPARTLYLELRTHLLKSLQTIYQLSKPQNDRETKLETFKNTTIQFNQHFHTSVFSSINSGKINRFEMSSIINDTGYVIRITDGLYQVLNMATEHATLIPTLDPNRDQSGSYSSEAETKYNNTSSPV